MQPKTRDQILTTALKDDCTQCECPKDRHAFGDETLDETEAKAPWCTVLGCNCASYEQRDQ